MKERRLMLSSNRGGVIPTFFSFTSMVLLMMQLAIFN